MTREIIVLEVLESGIPDIVETYKNSVLLEEKVTFLLGSKEATNKLLEEEYLCMSNTEYRIFYTILNV